MVGLKKGETQLRSVDLRWTDAKERETKGVAKKLRVSVQRF